VPYFEQKPHSNPSHQTYLPRTQNKPGSILEVQIFLLPRGETSFNSTSDTFIRGWHNSKGDLTILNWELGIVCIPDSTFPHPWDILRKTFQFDEAQQIVKMEHGLPWLGFSHFVGVIKSRIRLVLSELTPDNVDKTAESIAKMVNLVSTKTCDAFMFVAEVIYDFATRTSNIDDSGKTLTAYATLFIQLDQFVEQNISGENLYVQDEGRSWPRLQRLRRCVCLISSSTLQTVLDQRVDQTENLELNLPQDAKKKELHLKVIQFNGELFKQKILTGSDMCFLTCYF
jgi:hypothetical protein